MLNKFVTKSQKGVSMIQDALIAAQVKLFCIKSQKGVTMIEYTLIASLVAAAIIGSFTVIGPHFKAVLDAISAKIVAPV